MSTIQNKSLFTKLFSGEPERSKANFTPSRFLKIENIWSTTQRSIFGLKIGFSTMLIFSGNFDYSFFKNYSVNTIKHIHPVKLHLTIQVGRDTKMVSIHMTQLILVSFQIYMYSTSPKSLAKIFGPKINAFHLCPKFQKRVNLWRDF